MERTCEVFLELSPHLPSDVLSVYAPPSKRLWLLGVMCLDATRYQPRFASARRDEAIFQAPVLGACGFRPVYCSFGEFTSLS